MALLSPGVEVTVINESFYTPSSPGTVPMLFVATAQDKSNASSTGIAQGTLASNIGKVWAITGQRDLSETFGTPIFYTDTNGNPIHGGELNEYGLQAAYSLLGVSSKAYVVRTDVDLGQLIPQSSAPSGTPVSGTYWVDTISSLYGINEWNASTKTFVTKTPLIIDNGNLATQAVLSGSMYTPADVFGQPGDYAVVVTSNNTNAIYYKTTSPTDAWVMVKLGFDGSKSVKVSPHTDYPDFTSAITGSVWIKTTPPGMGANWQVKTFVGATKTWTTNLAPVYGSTRQAIQMMDFTGGGKNIPVGTVFVESNYEHSADQEATFKVWRRASSGVTAVTSTPGQVAVLAGASDFNIRETIANGTNWGATYTVNLAGSSSIPVAKQLVIAINTTAGLVNIVASYDEDTQSCTLTHKLGGEFEMLDGNESPLFAVGFFAGANIPNLLAAPVGDGFGTITTNWKSLVYEAKQVAPTTYPADGRLWYNSIVDQVDVMVHDGMKWAGYASVFATSDPAGPIISALAPTVQSDGTPLVAGDIWISTADIEMYGQEIYVYDTMIMKWVLQDTTDQSTPDGWLFADARWSLNGADVVPASIVKLRASSYVDPDAPDPALYPKGMRLWNLRRSGFNIKKYISGHLNLTANNGQNIRFNNASMAGYSADRWVTVSANSETGSGSFGRHAQRGYIVKQLKALIDTNIAARDTDTLIFNLIATPGYPEVIQNMVSFNVDRGQSAFVIGDTPFRLAPTGTALAAWGNNSALAYDNGDTGAVTYDEYTALFYPSGYTTDNVGNNIVVPASHMMLRTFVNSDAKSYQWFAPAGTRRGGVDNATSVGYITAEGEFMPAALPEVLRDVMASVKINPIATLPGVGLVNFGQYTRAREASAMDRINVARLVGFLRRQLTILAKPFLFEPNDAQTRRELKSAAESLMLELVGQRAIYDFAIDCSSSNNTPARIDRSELYMDIAFEPVKSTEFIFIPLRIKNTGAISAGV